MDIERVLIAEIKKSKLSRYEIARLTGVDASVLSRFVRRQRSIDLRTAKILLRFFGYTLAKLSQMPKLQPPRKRGRPKKELPVDN